MRVVVVMTDGRFLTPRERELYSVGERDNRSTRTASGSVLSAIVIVAGLLAWSWLIVSGLVPQVLQSPTDTRSQYLGGTSLMHHVVTVPGLVGVYMRAGCVVGLWVGGIAVLASVVRMAKRRFASVAAAKAMLLGAGSGLALLAVGPADSTTVWTCRAVGVGTVAALVVSVVGLMRTEESS